MKSTELSPLNALNAAVLSDVMDGLGLNRQAMKPFIRPLDDECAGVAVRSGDIVFGDVDGVVVIPREHEHEIVTRAVEKTSGEKASRDALRQGELLGDVFRRFGIL